MELVRKDCTMSQTDTRSLQQIKRETEQTRAGLTKYGRATQNQRRRHGERHPPAHQSRRHQG